MEMYVFGVFSMLFPVIEGMFHPFRNSIDVTLKISIHLFDLFIFTTLPCYYSKMKASMASVMKAHCSGSKITEKK
jgi:hypothetical protein